MSRSSSGSDGQFAGLVNIGTYSLYMEVNGIARGSNVPERSAIIIIQGIGSTIHEWPAATRGLAKLSRVVSYERSGFGLSEISENLPTAAQAATELDSVLHTAGILAPYIIVAHSYGGIIAREYLHIRPQSVSGIVFVDANTEETPSTYFNEYVRAMLAGRNTLEVTIGNNHALTQQEWNALLKPEDNHRNEVAAAREAAYYRQSGKMLATKSQLSLPTPLLGDIPVTVLHADYSRDISAIFAAGVRAGNGTEDERQGMIEFMRSYNKQEERMQRKMLALSSKGKFKHIPNSGHQIHMVKPEVIVEAVRSLIIGLDRQSI